MDVDCKRGLRKITDLVNRAKREKITKGPRERLGYDSITELKSYLSQLDLSYIEYSRLIKVFHYMCSKI